MKKRYHNHEGKKREMKHHHESRMRHEKREYHEGFGEEPRQMSIAGTRSIDEGFGRPDWNGSMGYAQRKARIDREDYKKLHKHYR